MVRWADCSATRNGGRDASYGQATEAAKAIVRASGETQVGARLYLPSRNVERTEIPGQAIHHPNRASERSGSGGDFVLRAATAGENGLYLLQKRPDPKRENIIARIKFHPKNRLFPCSCKILNFDGYQEKRTTQTNLAKHLKVEQSISNTR